MKYTNLDHKKMWVEKLENDLKQLESVGYDKNSSVYKDGKRRTYKAKKELRVLESKVQ